MVQRLDGSYMSAIDNINERPPTTGTLCGRKTSPYDSQIYAAFLGLRLSSEGLVLVLFFLAPGRQGCG